MAAALEALRVELDPNGRHSPQKVRAALKALGLEPEDVAPLNEAAVKVSSKIPNPDKAEKVKLQRLDVWEGLRDSRLDELRNTLGGLCPDDVRRYNLTGDGVRAVTEDDLPDVTLLRAGGDDFEEMQARRYAKLKAEQQRKADKLVTGFLQEKRRMEEAEAKIAAFTKQLAEKKAEQQAARKAKAVEAQKKEERRQQMVQRSAKERQEYEEETETKLSEKMKEAAKRRSQSTSELREKLASDDHKRREAFRKALNMEDNLLSQIELKQERLEERLEARREQLAEQQQIRAETIQVKFHERQMRMAPAEEARADEKLAKHKQFLDRHKKVREEHNLGLKTKSKSCSDFRKKYRDKWKGNHDKLVTQRGQDNEEILARHEAASERVEKLMPLKLKCGGDVFSYQEVKYGTWGELHQQRHQALQKSREAHTQAFLYEIAEFDNQTRMQQEASKELDRRRQQIAKETLALKDRAKEGFLKIKRESDERKIHGVMTSLGFRMPTLVDDEEEQGPEESKPAF